MARRLLHLIPTITFSCMASVALAEGHERPVDLTVACNAHGAAITVNDGAFAGKTLYLGKDCDAAEQGGGSGKWYYAAGAFIVEIEGRGMRFANDVSCPSLPYCTFARTE